LQMSNATTKLSTTRANVRAKVVKGRGNSWEEELRFTGEYSRT
jgi:hypothetical protein